MKRVLIRFRRSEGFVEVTKPLASPLTPKQFVKALENDPVEIYGSFTLDELKKFKIPSWRYL